MRRALRMTEETYTKLRVLLGVELAVRQQRRLVVLRTVFGLEQRVSMNAKKVRRGRTKIA